VGGEGEGVFEELSGFAYRFERDVIPHVTFCTMGCTYQIRTIIFLDAELLSPHAFNRKTHEDLKRKEGATKETILTVCRGDHLAFILSRRPSFFPLVISCSIGRAACRNVGDLTRMIGSFYSLS